MEIWKDVVGYEGLYEISNIGNVKSLNYRHTGKSKILQPCKRNGYYSVVVCKDGIKKHKTIHSLVVESFIDKDYVLKGLVANHKNFKKDNNFLENLEIVTIRENSNKKHLQSSSKYTGVHKQKSCKSFYSSIVINGSLKYLGSFDTEKEASEYYEAALICLNDNRINDIVVKRKKAKGVYMLGKKWTAQIVVNRKLKYLGIFNTKEEASLKVEEYKKANEIVF